jgi:hypothetical protein
MSALRRAKALSHCATTLLQEGFKARLVTTDLKRLKAHL